jgi:hypothetical protein
VNRTESLYSACSCIVIGPLGAINVNGLALT